MDQDKWRHKRDVLISIICIGIILWAVWTFMGQFIDIIIIFLLSVALAFLLTPLVDILVKNKIPRLLATIVVYVLVLIVIGSFSSAVILSLVQQVVALSATVTDFFNALPALSSQFQHYLVSQGIPQDNITQALDQVRMQAVAYAQIAAQNALNIVFVLSNAVINILLVLVLSFYITVDGRHIRDSLVGIAPKRWLPHVFLFEEALNKVVGNYIRGQLTLALIVGILAALVCFITDLRGYALIIGVLAFIFETIPMVGPALASIPAILLSLLLPAPFPRTLYVVLWFVGIQLVESNILGPRIVGHAVGLHPVASILALLVGAKLFGVFGALIATPLVATAWVVVASLYRSARGESPEQILSRKRTAWGLPRRPDVRFLRRRGGAAMRRARDGDSANEKASGDQEQEGMG